MMEKLLWQNIITEPGQAAHVKRTWMPEGERTNTHRHDFAEVFFVLDGAGRHFRPGGEDVMHAGCGYLISPEIAHSLGGDAPDGVEYINLAFPAAIWRNCLRRYPELCRTRKFQFSPEQTRYLRVLAEQVGAEQISALQRDYFLLSFFREGIPGADGERDFSRCPDWLAAACRAMREPGNFCLGAGRLAELCGRTPEHVARELKRTAGVTPVELATALRMKHAGQLLRFSRKTLLEIALECGYNSFSHFHHIFRRHYALTPLQYKKKNQRV